MRTKQDETIPDNVAVSDPDRESITEEQDEAYWSEVLLAQEFLSDLSDQLVQEDISTEEFVTRLEQFVQSYYIRLALLGRGSDELEDVDIEALEAFIQDTHDRLDSFEEVLVAGEISTAYILWRTELYSNARQVFIWYSLPSTISFSLPAFPGIDCLGNGACGCRLEWELVGEEAHIYWIIDPQKSNCSKCKGFAVDWNPLVVTG